MLYREIFLLGITTSQNNDKPYEYKENKFC